MTEDDFKKEGHSLDQLNEITQSTAHAMINAMTDNLKDNGFHLCSPVASRLMLGALVMASGSTIKTLALNARDVADQFHEHVLEFMDDKDKGDLH